MFEEVKEKTINSRWLVLIMVLIMGIMLFSVMAKIISTTTYKKAPTDIVAQFSTTSPTLFNAQVWKEIDKFSASGQDRFLLKYMFVKSSIEASMLNGTQLITAKVSLKDIIDTVDAFYADQSNKNVPLYFALVIANMIRSGRTEREILIYKANVLARLEKSGMLKR